METNGLLTQQAAGTDRTEEEVELLNQKLGAMRKEEITTACSPSEQQWNDPEAELADQNKVLSHNAVPVPGEDANVTAKEVTQKNTKGGLRKK
jgi:hypothetical protein